MLYILLTVEIIIYILRAVKSWSHVIIIILILEFFRIGGFMAGSVLRVATMGPLIVFLFAVVIVCEARVGIGLIVRLTRGRGDEIIRV